MTVKELIERLQTFPETCEVRIESIESDIYARKVTDATLENDWPDDSIWFVCIG